MVGQFELNSKLGVQKHKATRQDLSTTSVSRTPGEVQFFIMRQTVNGLKVGDSFPMGHHTPPLGSISSALSIDPSDLKISTIERIVGGWWVHRSKINSNEYEGPQRGHSHISVSSSERVGRGSAHGFP
jgi:hypothetical protein